MKNNFFTKEEIRLILDLLDDINEDPDLSFMYSYVGHEMYARLYDSVYEKLESYSPLTYFSLGEIEVVRDALRPLDAAEDIELSPDIRSLVNATCRKVQNILSALAQGSK